MLHDRVFSARDIFSHRIDANLVTLSACETGIHDTRLGSELVGMTRSLLYAGAGSIVVSQWQAEVYATKELMIRLYKNIKRGESIAVALQKAQLEIMNYTDESNEEIYLHPCFWAPFILVGNT